MSTYSKIEQLLDVHPLDEVGRDINEILQTGHNVIRTDTGVAYAKAIKLGGISIFFSRYHSSSKDVFNIGFDLISGGEYTPLCDDFTWNIFNPENTEDSAETLELLKEVVHLAGCLGDQYGEA